MTQTGNPWGSDLWIGPNADGILDLDPSGRLATGMYVLVQSVIMRQTTPNGSLVGAPDECFNIRDWISTGITNVQIQSLQGYIQGQLLRDERILTANVTASYNFGTSVLTIVEQVQSSLGPFKLTLSVGQASALSINVLYSGGS